MQTAESAPLRRPAPHPSRQDYYSNLSLICKIRLFQLIFSWFSYQYQAKSFQPIKKMPFSDKLLTLDTRVYYAAIEFFYNKVALIFAKVFTFWENGKVKIMDDRLKGCVLQWWIVSDIYKLNNSREPGPASASQDISATGWCTFISMPCSYNLNNSKTYRIK